MFVIFCFIVTPNPNRCWMNAFSVIILVSLTLAMWTFFQNFWKIYIFYYTSSSQISGLHLRSTLNVDKKIPRAEFFLLTTFTYLPWQYIWQPQDRSGQDWAERSKTRCVCHILINSYSRSKMISIECIFSCNFSFIHSCKVDSFSKFLKNIYTLLYIQLSNFRSRFQVNLNVDLSNLVYVSSLAIYLQTSKYIFCKSRKPIHNSLPNSLQIWTKLFLIQNN